MAQQLGTLEHSRNCLGHWTREELVFDGLPHQSSLVLASSSVVGGKSTTGTVTVSGPGGAVVSLASGNTALVKVPASVQIPVGASSASFTITTSRVRTTTPVTITGTANRSSVGAVLTLTR